MSATSRTAERVLFGRGRLTMGYKDDKWNEAPGYCVECDNLRPLNKSAVCERCHNHHPNSWYERWEESAYCSKWYYHRAGRTVVTDSG